MSKNKPKPLFLVLLSAFLYSLSFAYPFSCGLLILFTYIIIFNLFFAGAFTLYLASVWSIIVWAVQAYPLYSPLALLLSSRLSAFISLVILIIYTSIYSIIWLYIASFIGSFIVGPCVNSLPIRLSSLFFYSGIFMLILSTYLYISWIDYGFLWIFDYCEGCAYLHPLVPLMAYSIGQYGVLLAGKQLVTIFMLIITLILGFFAYRFSYFFIIYALIGCFSIVLSNKVIFHNFTEKLYESFANKNHITAISYYDCENILNVNVDNFGSIILAAPTFTPDKKVFIWDKAHEIADIIEKIKDHYSLVDLIILPESAFPFNLNCYPEIIEYWLTCCLDATELIIGSHREEKREEKKYTYNSCYLISKKLSLNSVFNNKLLGNKLLRNKLRNNYTYRDKGHGLLLAERMPSVISTINNLSNSIKNKSINLTNREDVRALFDQAIMKKRKAFKCFSCHIYCILCSEFFFHAHDISKNEPTNKNNKNILCIMVNDAWFADSFLSDLLYLYAILYAKDTRSTLLYSGYKYKSLIK